MKKKWKVLSLLLLPPLLLVGYVFFAQLLLPHDTCHFTPDYPKVELTKQSSYETIFRQTGLGPQAAESVLQSRGVEGLREYQEAFFAPQDCVCSPVFSFWTKEDRLSTPYELPFADLQPGDIILSLSTHSMGWRHGHAGLYMLQDFSLESISKGSNTRLDTMDDWRHCSQFAILRLKDRPEEFSRQMLFYAMDNLMDVPYRFSCGFLGPKAPAPDEPGFGVHCIYLIWYAYQAFGYDLDSDGGRLVSGRDILESPLLEVVQIYGMDPASFPNAF